MLETLRYVIFVMLEIKVFRGNLIPKKLQNHAKTMCDIRGYSTCISFQRSHYFS